MLQSLQDALQAKETEKRQREEQAEKEAAEKFLDELFIDPYPSPVPSPTHSPLQADRGKNIAAISDMPESSHSLSSTGRSNPFLHPAHQTDQRAMPDAPWFPDNEEAIDDDIPFPVPSHTLATPADQTTDDKGKGIAGEVSMQEPVAPQAERMNRGTPSGLRRPFSPSVTPQDDPHAIDGPDQTTDDKGKGIAGEDYIPEPVAPQAERMNRGTPSSPMRPFSPSVIHQDDPKGKAVATSSYKTDQTDLLQTETASPTLSGAEASDESWAPSPISSDSEMEDNALSAPNRFNPFMRTRSKRKPAENSIARQLPPEPSSPVTPKSKRHNKKNSYTPLQRESFIQFYKDHSHHRNMSQLLREFKAKYFQLPKITGREWLQDAGLIPLQSQKQNIYRGLWSLLNQPGIPSQSLNADSHPVQTFLDRQVEATHLQRSSLKRWVGHFFRDRQAERLPDVMAPILNIPATTLRDSILLNPIHPVSVPRYNVERNFPRIEADRPTAPPAGIARHTDSQTLLAQWMLNPFPSGGHTGKRKAGETSGLTDHPDGGKKTKAMPDTP